METINVELGQGNYPIVIGEGLINQAPLFLTDRSDSRRVVIITQTPLVVAGQQLTAAFSDKGYIANLVEVADGERAKTLAQVEKLYVRLIELGCDRGTVLVALGGGTVGDLTGFVAATFLRGIQYLQVPTTLLAMVDSAIGGKTGVNLAEGKNLVGAIYQPLGVLIDIGFLESLPRREIISGTAEVLKYGAIRDREFLEFLSDKLISSIDSQPNVLAYAIQRSCEIKAKIVAVDEHDLGMRRILNFGHSIGHTLENLAGYGQLRHGEAVAYGMLCAGSISRQRGFINDNEWKLLKTTIKKLNLPALPATNGEKVLELLGRDKKVKAGQLHFILLQPLGNAVVTADVTEAEILQSLEEL